jgi:hypothetical protein
VWLTGEKTTAGWDGRAGAVAADHLYATAATEMPSGRPTMGGVAVQAVLRRHRPRVASPSHARRRRAAAARASPRASPPLARARGRDFSREVVVDDFFPVSTSLG